MDPPSWGTCRERLRHVLVAVRHDTHLTSVRQARIDGQFSARVSDLPGQGSGTAGAAARRNSLKRSRISSISYFMRGFWWSHPLALVVVSLMTLSTLASAGAKPHVPKTAPAFHLPTRLGAASLDSLRGQVVLVDFWASWCAPCLRSFPWMDSLVARYGDRGFRVV